MNRIRSTREKIRNKLYLVFILLSIGFVNCQPKSEKISASDFTHLYQTLITEHPKLSLVEERNKIDSLYNAFQLNFENLERTEAILEIMRFVASLDDGHTSIARIWDDNTKFRSLPFRLYWFKEGLHISRIDAKLKNYGGMKVLRIGGKNIDEVMIMARPYIHGDNEMAIKNVLPNRLSQYDFLIGLNLGDKDGSISFTLEGPDGKIQEIFISQSNLSDNYNMISARKDEVKIPLYLVNKGNYWHTYLEDEKLMYFQFNAVSEMDNKPFKKYIEELFVSIDSLAVEKLVIDIRNNNGGDNTILKPLIHALIQSDKVNKENHLFTVIGRLTFSAAVSLATELEQHTETIFVGEPTSASPNHYGETKLGELPTSKIKFLYSSQYWQGSLPWDDRDWIEPSIMVEESIIDYINGGDPCLQEIIKHTTK